MSPRSWAAVAAIDAFFAVAAGAFGAHGLKARVTPDLLAIFETGARYQTYHALGLLGVAWLASEVGPSADRAGWLMLAGSVVFSGSLYALTLTGVRALGAVTPIGGVLLLASWLAFAWAAVRG